MPKVHEAAYASDVTDIVDSVFEFALDEDIAGKKGLHDSHNSTRGSPLQT
jgi:hypothetical protein